MGSPGSPRFWAFVAALGLGASCLIAPEALPSGAACWMRAWFGLPCPACGITHGLCALGHGRWADAWSLNPLSYGVWAGALVLVLNGAFGGRPGLWAERRVGSWAWAPWVVGGFFLVWWVRLS